MTVDSVEEQDARLAVLPCAPDHVVEEVPGADRPHGRPAAGLTRGKIEVLSDRGHECVRDTHREIEAAEKERVALDRDELLDVGVVDSRTPMLAPRLVPPCLMMSVALLNTSMNETGPLATPLVLRTMSFLGRRWLKENPVPPLWWMMAVFFTASKMDPASPPQGARSMRQAVRVPCPRS